MIIINQFHREFSENPLRRKLKELRNYNHKLLIVSATKIGGNTTNIINCYFFSSIFTLWHTKLTINMQRNKSNSYNQYSLGLSSLEMQRVLQAKYTTRFFTLKETTPKPSKIVTAKSFFSSVYYMIIICYVKCFMYKLEDITDTLRSYQPPCSCAP